jgi:uncharacterized membrane protein
MISPRSRIIEYIVQGLVSKDKIDEALTIAMVTPNTAAWRLFIDHLLLWIGGLALAFSSVFFIAYNWSALGHFAKFGLVELLIILAIGMYWKLGSEAASAKVSLLVATIFLGVLLALFGQTYQTGADPWQLFFNWALLMIPWAVVSRFSAIWILWLALINLTVVLYFQTFVGVLWFINGSDTPQFWFLFAINITALVTWELLMQKWRWLQQRWAICMLGVGSGVPITWLVLYAIFESSLVATSMIPVLIWGAWMSSLYVVYRKIRLDLFMLAGGCFSGMVVIVAFFSKQMLRYNDPSGFLFIALLIIALGTGSAIWLRNIHREVQV